MSTSMITKGLSDSVVYGLSSVVVKLIGFLMLLYYTHLFAPEDIALITLVMVLSPLLRTVLPLEISQATVIFAVNHPKDKDKFYGMGLMFTLMVHATFLCLYLLFAKVTHIAEAKLYGLIIIALMAESFYYYELNLCRWQLMRGLYNAISIAVVFIESSVIVLLFYLYHPALHFIFLSWLVVRSIGFITLLYINCAYHYFSFDKYWLKQMLKFSYPLALNNLPQNLYLSMDRFVVIKILGMGMAGIYGTAMIFSGFVTVVLNSFSTALTPIIFRSRLEPNADKSIATLAKLIVTLLLLLPVLFMLFSHEVVALFLNKGYKSALQGSLVVPLLMLYAIFNQLYIFAPGFLASKKTKLIAIVSCINLVINLISAIPMTYYFGLMGTAIAVMSTSLIGAFVYIVWAQKYYRVAFNIRAFVMIAIVFICFLAMAYTIDGYFIAFSLHHVLYKVSLAIILSISTLSWCYMRYIKPTAGFAFRATAKESG